MPQATLSAHVGCGRLLIRFPSTTHSSIVVVSCRVLNDGRHTNVCAPWGWIAVGCRFKVFYLSWVYWTPLHSNLFLSIILYLCQGEDTNLRKNQLSEKNEVASWTGHTIRLRHGPLVSPLGDHTTRTEDKGGEMTWTNPEEATRSGRGQHNTG